MSDGLIQKVFKEYVARFDNCTCDFCKLLPFEIIELQQEIVAEIKKQVLNMPTVTHESKLRIFDAVSQFEVMRLLLGTESETAEK